MHLSELLHYPVKSLRGCHLTQAQVTPQGLAGDREWLVATEDGSFITAREQPRLLCLQAEQTAHGVRLSAPDGRAVQVGKTECTQPQTVQVWRDRFEARHGAIAADAWLSAYLGQACRLYHLGAHSQRRLAEHDLPLSFADGAPYLLTNTASLRELNRHLARPVEMVRFRPNLVVTADFPYEEDEWQRIRIGTVEFERLEPCERCVMITVDGHTGQAATDGEPLHTLLRTHGLPEGACFGVHMRALNSGIIQPGDELTVLAHTFAFD